MVLEEGLFDSISPTIVNNYITVTSINKYTHKKETKWEGKNQQDTEVPDMNYTSNLYYLQIIIWT
jgi:flagellar hook assembly protein FlgD